MLPWLTCAGGRFVTDPSGALVWPAHELVVVADLHLEKGSAFAGRGVLLPPYDTRSTLARLETVLARWRPRRVISLGDAFHDRDACHRLSARDRRRLGRVIAAHDWFWVRGNHDPDPPAGLDGWSGEAVEIGRIAFLHQPGSGSDRREIAGHLHPKASVCLRSRRLSRPCFVSDRQRMILPAFGSFTGGLDVCDPAISKRFQDGFSIRLLGRRQVYPVPVARLNGQAAVTA